MVNNLILEYPAGTTMIDGVSIPNRHLAQQILDGLRMGKDVLIPQNVNQFGGYLWRLRVWDGQALTGDVADAIEIRQKQQDCQQQHSQAQERGEATEASCGDSPLEG